MVPGPGGGIHSVGRPVRALDVEGAGQLPAAGPRALEVQGAVQLPDAGARELEREVVEGRPGSDPALERRVTVELEPPAPDPFACRGVDPARAEQPGRPTSCPAGR